MSSRAKTPRPEGTDGTDHEYRMVIENRYKQLSQHRRKLEVVSIYLTLFVGLQAIWRCLSYLLGGSTGGLEALTHVAWTGFRTALLVYGGGFGQRSKEKIGVLQGYQSLHTLYLLQALRDGVIQALLMYKKISQGQEATMDGLLDINYPSAGANIFLFTLDFGEVILVVISWLYLRKYIAIKTGKKRDV
ncbi:hypothetical protein WJX73_007105 [Symbiochloris irregularis]|uniref:Uncharacterized protein n=1 Tax=Symbiochloris irregularis TaxID=706552 RepID=A0AAW1NZN7_9CHLO